jgi:hypothetical protein
MGVQYNSTEGDVYNKRNMTEICTKNEDTNLVGILNKCLIYKNARNLKR